MTPIDTCDLVTATGGAGIPTQQSWIQPLPDVFSASKIGWQSPSNKGLFPKLGK
jgi:hypothetical protein